MEKILLIDDNDDNLEILAIILADEGYTVKKMLSATAIWQVIADFKPKILFLDLLLGVENGTELCAALKADPQTAHVKIVMMSASDMLLAKAETQGSADHYLSKPFDISQITAITKELLQQR